MNSLKVVYIAAISLLFATITYSMNHQDKIRIMMSGSGDNNNYGLYKVSANNKNILPVTSHVKNPYFALSSTSSFDGAEFIKQATTSNENNNSIQNTRSNVMPKPKKSNNPFTCFGRK